MQGGTQKLVLADKLGPLTQSGKKTATICSKQNYQIYAAGTDYPAYEASYPKNLEQLPLIKAPNGQADVTTSDPLIGHTRSATMMPRRRAQRASLAALTAMIAACGGSPNTPNGPVVGSPGSGGPPPTNSWT